MVQSQPPNRTRTLHAKTASRVAERRTGRSGTDSRQTSSLSIVIPTYNERENVQRVIDRCLDAVTEYTVELIVVDDDSPDQTWRLARDTYRDDERVTVCRRTDDTGLATAVSFGFGESSNDICVVLDADLQHPPERIPDLLAAFEPGVDLVIGSRNLEDSDVVDWSRSRALLSDLATRWSGLVVPEARAISDPMSGFFAVRREVVEAVELNPLGYKIMLEILVGAEVERIREVSYGFSTRRFGESKLTVMQSLRFVEHTLKLGVESRWSG